MEPRPYGRGDHLALTQPSSADVALQWSHGHTAVETIHRAARSSYFGRLQWSHGHTAVETLHKTRRLQRAISASMEPRPYGRGDTRSVDDERVAGKALQWSHGHTAVETAAQSGRSTQNMWASMEPRPYGRGDFVDWRAGQRRAFRFNGATAIRPWRLRGRPRRPTEFRRFNGATAIRPWRLR